MTRPPRPPAGRQNRPAKPTKPKTRPAARKPAEANVPRSLAEARRLLDQALALRERAARNWDVTPTADALLDRAHGIEDRIRLAGFTIHGYGRKVAGPDKNSAHAHARPLDRPARESQG